MREIGPRSLGSRASALLFRTAAERVASMTCVCGLPAFVAHGGG